MKTYYIAFSIHGTNAFIIAKKDLIYHTEQDLNDFGYKTVESRFTLTQLLPTHVHFGTKLHWDGLTVKKTKQPYTNPSAVLKRFKELEAQGWTITGREKFIERNFKRGYKVQYEMTRISVSGSKATITHEPIIE